MEDKMFALYRVGQAAIKAGKYIGKTISVSNEDAVYEAYKKLTRYSEITLVGVKDTPQISRHIIRKLISSGHYIWHTIDKMAEGGRSVDISLVNPLTGKVMTGSSSATAVNILLGINDIGIGTDGGGSVLAPALSLNLYSIMAKGLGLKGNNDKISTDGIVFTPGIGILGVSFEKVRKAIFDLLSIKNSETVVFSGLSAAVCKVGCITLPDGSDMNKKLTKTIEILKTLGIRVYEEEYPDCSDRKMAIYKVKDLLDKYDLIFSYEGPIDLLGFGDSVFGCMGPMAKTMQNMSGKYIIKIANMLDATCITIPGAEVSSGVVITARHGTNEGLKAIETASILQSEYTYHPLYKDYFVDRFSRSQKSLIFSLEE